VPFSPHSDPNLQMSEPIKAALLVSPIAIYSD